MQHNLVVYTVAMGGDYDLPDIYDAASVEHICFTDQANLKANGWTLVHVEPLLPTDTFRSSREYKIRPHRYFPEYEKSIYVDSRVRLLKNPNDVWTYLIENEANVFGGLFHSFRDTVDDEFKAVREARLDYADVLEEQRDAYGVHHPQTLREKPVWGGILARRHNSSDCVEAMEFWFASIMRYSRRDQLSLPLALSRLSAQRKNIVTAELRRSEFHEWAKVRKPKPSNYTVTSRRLSAKPTRDHLKQPSKRNEKSMIGSKFLNLIMGREDNSKRLKPSENRDVRFGFDNELQLFFAEDAEIRVFVSDQKRLTLYKEGVNDRQRWLVSDYRLPTDLIRSGDVVVDIGANVGELGLWAEASGGVYYAFEPDPTAYRALQHNVVSKTIYDTALSDEDGQAEFYLSTATADSSLFKPSKTDEVVSVRKARLDTFFEEIGRPKQIRLLKIEAEGMEPEVLEGARQTLLSTEFVAVDAGPERGGDNTVPEVVNHLASAGFTVLDCYLKRGTFLFRRDI